MKKQGCGHYLGQIISIFGWIVWQLDLQLRVDFVLGSPPVEKSMHSVHEMLQNISGVDLRRISRTRN